MNKYDIAALIITGAVVVGLIAGLIAFAKTVSDFVDKTKGSD